MGSGEPPADGPQELTPAQLQMVEAIVERYTAALPKPLSRQKRRLAKAGITLGVLCLLGGLLGVSSRLDELDLRTHLAQEKPRAANWPETRYLL